MTAATSRTSFFEQLTSGNLNAIWSMRVMTAIALLTSAAAMWLFKSGSWHSFFVGATFGILIGLFAQVCNTRAVESGPLYQPSDVEDLRVTPV